MRSPTYETNVQVDDFTYYLVFNEQHSHASYMREKLFNPALFHVRETYDIFFETIPFGTLPEDTTYTYILYGPTDPLSMAPEEKTYLEKLVKLAEAKVNIVSVFDLEHGNDSQEYKEHSSSIPSLANELGVNVIFPDNILEDIGIRTVDKEDIQDNIVCETIRAKYTAIKDTALEDSTIASQENHTGDIEYIRKLYDIYHLWHRDATDGAVLIRTDSGYLISQTKTDKTVMRADDFSFVTDFNEEERIVYYSGKKIPSSDGPEYLVLSKLFEKKGVSPKYIIHFHHNESTRGDIFTNHCTSRKIEYGQFSSGYKIFDEITQIRDNWLVLLEHGILWWGDELQSFETFLTDTLKLSKGR